MDNNLSVSFVSKSGELRQLTKQCDREEAKITNITTEMQDYVEYVVDIIADLNQEMADTNAELQKISEQLEAKRLEYAAFEMEQLKLTADYESGEITKEEYDAKMAASESALAALRTDIAALEVEEANLKLGPNKLEEIDQKTSEKIADKTEVLINSENLAEYTSYSADKLVANNSKMKKMGWLTLGITSIIAAIRSSVSEKAKVSSANLANANTNLETQIEQMKNIDIVGGTDDTGEIPFPPEIIS